MEYFGFDKYDNSAVIIHNKLLWYNKRTNKHDNFANSPILNIDKIEKIVSNRKI